jgi:hypothetical protein
MKIAIPSLVGYAAENASEQATSAKVGFKINCKATFDQLNTR